MTKALEQSIAKTKENFERREDQQFKRGGFGHTAEFAAAVRDGLPARLAARIAERLAMRDDYGLRIAPPEELAVEGLASLLHSIVTEGGEPARSIDIGLRIQGRSGLLEPLQ